MQPSQNMKSLEGHVALHLKILNRETKEARVSRAVPTSEYEKTHPSPYVTSASLNHHVASLLKEYEET